MIYASLSGSYFCHFDVGCDVARDNDAGGGGHTQLDHSSEAHIATDDDVVVSVRIDVYATELEHLGVVQYAPLELDWLVGLAAGGILCCVIGR